MHGEIRNIKVLGVIAGKLVVAYQGQGKVHVYLENGSTLELEEMAPSGNERKYAKYLDAHNRTFRYAEYQVPPLPSSILVRGETEPSPEHEVGVTRKPAHESFTKAHVSVCGQVSRVQSFLPG